MFGWLVGSFVLVLRPTREYESYGRGLYHHHHHRRRRRSLISKRYYFRYRAAKFELCYSAVKVSSDLKTLVCRNPDTNTQLSACETSALTNCATTAT